MFAANGVDDGQGDAHQEENQDDTTVTIGPYSWSSENILAALKCRVCNQMLTDTIFQCETGHSVCSHCKLVHIHCLICGRGITDMRNYNVEGILGCIKKNCEYRSQGCDVLSKCNDNEHKKVCDFRPVICFEGGIGICSYTGIPYGQFIEHLINAHGSEEPVELCLNDEDLQNAERGISWPVFLMTRFNKWFIMEVSLHGNCVFIAVVHFGAEHEAQKYKCKVLLGDLQCESKNLCLEILHVHSFRKLEEDRNYFSFILNSEDFLRLGTRILRNNMESLISIPITCLLSVQVQD